MKNIYFILCLLLCQIGFAQTSGSVTQGLGTMTKTDLMPSCSSQRVAPIGTITSIDSKTWIVPSENNFLTANKLSDLYNICNNIRPFSLEYAKLSEVPTTVIDEQGEVITGYIFANNYFELYINGILVGVDAVPFTPLNSSVVKFKVAKPYTIAVRIVDWEQNLGLGSAVESSNALFTPGHGCFIAQFSDGTKTDASWKAQTYYISPIQDLNSIKELADGTRYTPTLLNYPACEANCYGIHYDIPSDWFSKNFNDSTWPNAVVYASSSAALHAAYTNFASTAWSNASLIWSSNSILDNVVLARKIVTESTSIEDIKQRNLFKINNPIENSIQLTCKLSFDNANIVLSNNTGTQIQQWNNIDINENHELSLQIANELKPGIYFLSIKTENGFDTYKLLKL